MTQDPALFEDNPLVQAAVAQERRFVRLEAAYTSLGSKLDDVLAQLGALNNKVGIQNGRVTTNEAEIAGMRQRESDRRLYPRLDELEAFRLNHDVAGAHDRGVQEGKVALRTSDKVALGAFASLIGVLVTVASKFL